MRITNKENRTTSRKLKRNTNKGTRIKHMQLTMVSLDNEIETKEKDI